MAPNSKLQAVRGICAMVVVLHHCLFFYATGPTFTWWAEAALNAHGAVILFFVLSGYVLGLSAVKSTSLGPIAFIIKRAFRLFPALWAAVVFAQFYKLVAGHADGEVYSQWYQAIDGQHIDAWAVLAASAGWGTAIIPMLWSIRIEIIASFVILPIAHLTRDKSQGWVLVAATAIMFWILGQALSITTAVLLSPFLLGLAIAVGPSSEQAFSSGKRLPTALLTTVALLNLCFFRLVSSDWRFETNYHAGIPTLVESFASAIIVRACVTQHVSIWRRLNIWIWIGDRSYSLYLIHFVVLAILGRVVAVIPAPPTVLTIFLVLLVTPASLMASHLLARWVEGPGVMLGKILHDYVKRLSPSRRSATIAFIQ